MLPTTIIAIGTAQLIRKLQKAPGADIFENVLSFVKVKLLTWKLNYIEGIDSPYQGLLLKKLNHMDYSFLPPDTDTWLYLIVLYLQTLLKSAT